MGAPRRHGSSTASEQNHENTPSTKDQTKKKLQPEGLQTGVFASCSFEDLGLHPTLCQQLQERMGFKVPTIIQAESIPLIISGRHVLVNAATGTGKTIAYLAPIIHHLQLYLPKIKRPDGTFALVLVPTRELCMQVYEILQKLLHRFHWIVPGYIMGGENRSKEKARLRKGITILVATPGRLLDHLKNTSSFSYNNLRWIIFDEADRILELGFGKEIEEILSLLGSGQNGFIGKESKFPRQNLLLSATLNEKVNDLAKISLENPVMIGLEDKNIFTEEPSISGRDFSTIGSDSNLESKNSSVGDYKLPAQLVQRYVKVTCGSRLVVLLSILRSLFERDVSQKIVVFFSTCDAVDFHYSLCSEFRCSSDLQAKPEENQIFINCQTFRLHGSMEQDDRRKMFQGFNAEKSAVLLCTDVAARGLDFPKVQYIIQYDSPGDAIEYVHRVGRTARLGKKGDALLFLQPVEIGYLQELQKHGVPLEEFSLHKLLDNFALRDIKHPKKKLVALEMHPWLVYLQRALESFVSKESTTKQMAKKAFLSWIRAYTAHRGELKRIFMVKKLHLGHVARSFGLKEQPTSVGGSFQAQVKKRKRDKKRGGLLKRRKITKKA